MTTLTIRPDGYWQDRTDQPFTPVGVNYWPSSCGVELWNEWPEGEILADLDAVAALGFNTIRFFIRWEDFEPRVGEYSERSLERLTRFLQACDERGLHPQPSFFVGWMSGGAFWPEWKGRRNLYASDEMLERAKAFAAVIAKHIRPHAENLCGVDVGNELNALADSFEAPPAAVRRWAEAMAAEIREHLPDVVILSGCDHQQVTADTGWRLGEQPHIDVLTMHGYPIPAWHPVPCGGMQDPLNQSLLPFYVKCARSFGPVMLQEFGTILTGQGASVATDAWLRAILPAGHKAGANGFLWWCFRDFTAEIHPYAKCPFERTLGLVDADRKVKPGLEYFVEFAKSVAHAPFPAKTEDAGIHLYWPKHYYDRENPQNPGNSPRESARRLLVANHLLEDLGHTVGIVHGGKEVPKAIGTILLTGMALDLHEINALRDWVSGGGRLLWHGPDPLGWSVETTDLLGADIADFLPPGPVTVEWKESSFSLSAYPRGMRVAAQPTTATQLSGDDGGNPLLLRNVYGDGVVLALLGDMDGGALDRWNDGGRASLRAWYALALEELAAG